MLTYFLIPDIMSRNMFMNTLCIFLFLFVAD